MRWMTLGWIVLLALLAIVGFSTTQALRAQSSAANQPPGLLARGRDSQALLGATRPLSGTWSGAFTQGIESLGHVTDIITAADGDMYMVGTFTQAGGVDALNLARWNGTQWSAVAASPPPGDITHIAIYHTEIYVATAGYYRTQHAGLWRYNATTQHWIRIGLPDRENSEVGEGHISNLLVFNDLLIASGQFDIMNGQPMPGIVAWDGSAFRSLAPHTPYFETYDLVITPDGLVAAGVDPAQSPSQDPAYLGRWDGSAWHPLTVPPMPVITGLDWEAGTLYVYNGIDEIQALTGTQWLHVSTVPAYTTFIGVINGKPYTRTCDATCGTMTLERWDGDTPETLASYSTRSGKSGVATIIDGDIYLGGTNMLTDGTRHALLRYRTGTLAGVFGRIVSVGPPLDLALDQGTLYVATNADFTGPLTASSGMAWENGAWIRWWPTDSRQSTNVVRHVRVLAHTDLLIGGRSLTISPTRTTALARRTQGQLSALDPQGHCAEIATTVYSGTTLLAVCRLPNNYDLEVTAFDGTQWSRLANDTLDDPEGMGYISDISQLGYHQRLYGLVREFGPYWEPADGYYVYSWSGTEWSKVRIANAPLRALAQTPGGLYVANANLYRAVGTGFEQIATTNGEIRTILVEGERIWIGGEFSQVNGVAANNIAEWDGQEWHALGAGTNGRVSRLDYDASVLAVGGSFSRAGGVPANGISLWFSQPVGEPGTTVPTAAPTTTATTAVPTTTLPSTTPSTTIPTTPAATSTLTTVTPIATLTTVTPSTPVVAPTSTAQPAQYHVFLPLVMR